MGELEGALVHFLLFSDQRPFWPMKSFLFWLLAWLGLNFNQIGFNNKKLKKWHHILFGWEEFVGCALMGEVQTQEVSLYGNVSNIWRGNFTSQRDLHKAMNCGECNTVDILLNEGAHPFKERDCDGQTALHYVENCYFYGKYRNDQRIDC